MKKLFLFLTVLVSYLSVNAQKVSISLKNPTDGFEYHFKAHGQYGNTDTVDLFFYFDVSGVTRDTIQIHHNGGLLNLDTFFTFENPKWGLSYKVYAVEWNKSDGLPSITRALEWDPFEPPFVEITPGTILDDDPGPGMLQLQIRATSSSDTLPWTIHYELSRNNSLIQEWDTVVKGKVFNYTKQFPQFYSGNFTCGVRVSNAYMTSVKPIMAFTLIPPEPTLAVSPVQIDSFWNSIKMAIEGSVFAENPVLSIVLTDSSGNQREEKFPIMGTIFGDYFTIDELPAGGSWTATCSVEDDMGQKAVQTLNVCTKPASDSIGLNYLRYHAHSINSEESTVDFVTNIDPKGHGPCKVSFFYTVNGGAIHWGESYESGYEMETFTFNINVPKNSVVSVTFFAQSILNPSMNALDSTIVNMEVLNIQDIEKQDVMIYPNPSIDGKFRVKGKVKNLTVFNSAGKKVLSTNKESFTHDKPGIYTVLVSDETSRTFHVRLTKTEF